MIDSHDETENIKYNKTKNSCNAYNAYNAYNNKNEKRENHCIRLRDSVHKAVRIYCGNRMTIGEFYEKAAILYMDINPIEFFGVNLLEPQQRQTSLEDKMTEMIALADIEEWLEGTRKLVEDGVVIHKTRIKTLLGIIRDCRKVNNRSSKLDELIEEAMMYVTESY